MPRRESRETRAIEEVLQELAQPPRERGRLAVRADRCGDAARPGEREVREAADRGLVDRAKEDTSRLALSVHALGELGLPIREDGEPRAFQIGCRKLAREHDGCAGFAERPCPRRGVFVRADDETATTFEPERDRKPMRHARSVAFTAGAVTARAALPPCC